jgi:pre-mRNA-splicing factor ISY1
VTHRCRVCNHAPRQSHNHTLFRYFGAAKNLPGVKELFEKEGPRVLRRSRFDMHKAIDADYYGFRDEDDGVLVRAEAEAERAIKKRVRFVLSWHSSCCCSLATLGRHCIEFAFGAKRCDRAWGGLTRCMQCRGVPRSARRAGVRRAGVVVQILDNWNAKAKQKQEAMQQLRSREAANGGAGADDSSQLFVAYVPLPEQKEIEMRVMAKKKEELLAKYASEGLIRQQEEAKQLLNVQD